MKTILQEKETIHHSINNLVHKFILMPQAMKIPAAKAAVDKEWETLEKFSASNLTTVISKSEVIDEARTLGAKVHFASLMDMCHLKNAELEAKHQKYKGRVVLRGDIVKDDSGSYAVFTEQGSSASQMTAKVWLCMQCISEGFVRAVLNVGCNGSLGVFGICSLRVPPPSLFSSVAIWSSRVFRRVCFGYLCHFPFR